MADSDRSLEKALTNQLIDEYFYDAESWMRAILRMCIFSVTPFEGKTVLLVECPNKAVAKRLSPKIWRFKSIVYHLAGTDSFRQRLLLCYKDSAKGTWQCYYSKTESWIAWDNQSERSRPG